jgi:protein-S-isoprenylcysteine O-methyltransferase Ste14
MLLVRALTYATLFIAIVLVFLPSRVLQTFGFREPAEWQLTQIAGVALVVIGALLAVWSILVFVFVGRGTPAPFDPPRRLVIRGPYTFVRNPMYIGAGIALSGAALFYESIGLFAYVIAYFVILHLFVLLYEEPTLRRTFGAEYDEYLERVRRWWPKHR